MARSTVWFLSAALRISSGSSRSPRRDASLNTIEREFDSQLQGLLESFEEDSSSPLNLQWLQQALTVVHSVNSAVEALVPSVSLPVSDRDDKWFQDYLDDNSKLLDACNYIKETIEQVCSYQLLVSDVVRSLESHDSQRARNALKECRRRDDTNKSKLESCSSILRRTGDRIGSSSVASGFLSATYASKLLTVFICGVLAACMCFKPKRGLCTLHCSSSYLWSSSMLSLQQRVKEEVERHKHTGSASHLSELARLDLCLGKLQELSSDRLSLSETDLEDELSTLCGELHDLGEEIETGLKAVHHQVNEVFRVLVATRVALLDLFSHPRNFSS